MSNLNAYLSEVRRAISNKDGTNLRRLLQLDSDAALVAMQIAQRNGSVPGNVVGSLPEGWGPIIASLLQSMLLQQKGERAAACKEFREKHASAIISILRSEKDPWLIPPLTGTILTLQQLSQQADDDLVRRGQPATQMAAFSIVLQSAFTGTMGPALRGSVEMKRATVATTCTMMKVYFRLNTINNCKSTLSNVDKPEFFDVASAAHKTTLRYYTGRLAAYDEDFAKADDHLSLAYSLCHPAAKANQRRILRYLIPVKMLMGVLPGDALLTTHGLTEYKDIKAAVKTGNVLLLQSTLETHQAKLIQSGTYLLLERLQLAVYRRLFKRCFLLHAQAQPAKSHQVSLTLFQSALALQGVSKDMAELQCILANLIYRKYVKGYIAFKSQVVVLAKTDPFPNLATVQLSDPFGL